MSSLPEDKAFMERHKIGLRVMQTTNSFMEPNKAIMRSLQ
jgi:hypothetical protein